MRYLSLLISLSVVCLLLIMLIPGTSAAAPVANFNANRTYGAVPLTVSFTDASSDNPTGWAWYFGDETYAKYWMQVNASAGWSARVRHSSVSMPDGSIVLMGGLTDTQILKNDVWRSTDNGTTWTQVNESAGWSARHGHSSVVMPDGSIVLMGGWDGSNALNDVWRSTDKGTTWTQVNAGYRWSARFYQSSVVMPDGSIVLMGGDAYSGRSIPKNDVWQSTDFAAWTKLNESAGWGARYGNPSVAMPDGSIVLIGGYGGGVTFYNDVWRSMDNGETWTQVNASPGWDGRTWHSGVVMPDGSILMMGGSDYWGNTNDVWRSTDNGATWTRVDASAEWIPRNLQSTVVMPDGSIVLMGGQDSSGYKNDVWRVLTAGSKAQNPSHTYTTPGIYKVALQAYNADGYTSMRKAGYITVTSTKTRIGVVRNNKTWILDASGNGVYGAGDIVYNYGIAGDKYVIGDWNGNGSTRIGVVRFNNLWLLDASGNGAYGAGDLAYTFGKAGDVYVTGDWDGNGKTKIGVVRFNTTWLLDASGDGKWGPGDYQYVYGRAGDVYVTGDWNGDHKTEIGVIRNNKTWILDASGNGAYDAGDIVYNYGIAGDRYVMGDWADTGTTRIGVVRFNTTWLLDASGNGLWGPGDYQYVYGRAGDEYVTGQWN